MDPAKVAQMVEVLNGLTARDAFTGSGGFLRATAAVNGGAF